MCGIVGLVTQKSWPADTLHNDIHTMSRTLAHRGPDDQGLWLDAEAGVAFGHRRLAIVDLSPAGHQPMVSQCGRWVMCYNGETYSQAELKPILSSHNITLRGHSDTEVMLESCALLGVHKALKHFIGMFAFALWDRHDRVLYLVRDRLGIKPLYWTYQNQTLFFASELKALKAHREVVSTTDRKALASYLNHGYIPAPHSIYENIYKLPQGHILTYRPGSEPVIEPYWALKDVVIGKRSITPEQAVEELHELLKDAVGRRMMADVPLGAFLSGGIDSSLVVSLMQSQSTQPIKTFTIGFEQKKYNEAEHARQIAQHLGTEHTELFVTAQQAQAVIPKLHTLYDEPFADASQIPTFLVAQLARQHVTVALSGDGGDESFGGYRRHAFGQKIQGWWPLVQRIGALLPKKYTLPFIKDGEKIGRLLQSKSQQQLYDSILEQWPNPALLLPGVQPYNDNLWPTDALLPDLVDKMRYADTIGYLADDVLVKLDRATMGVGLEARVPLLDHRVVTWAWQQPHTLYQGKTKWLLRQILKRYVPEPLFERPKMGFSVPIGDWLRGDLKEWAHALLNEDSLKQTFEPKLVLQAWQNHQKGQSSQSQRLWNILMFQAWKETLR
ncbi:asparagine synthase (glutamine-hydrolyzing) [Candidatus Finniella inopinata]|uniref:asparagine synthase (glutamine-hydrolyzing) n=1 Tax=Candidatus Finniella inopinata TaxID=1696036 RepID=A0A4Q7DES1_9PROT|nr:asparagine synthase (glutamine-hydrolyzing) [Candidatus Finniella inopinata]RZI45142.1 asparagine synthase (glutamine-hydrolyzing) [Candidatus Finniella inopinata]